MKTMAMLLVLVSGAALAAPDCKPVVGHFEAQVVPVGEGHCVNVPPQTLCTAGRVWGGIQGTYEFVMSGVMPSALIGGVPSVLFYTGKSTVFLKSGDQVVGTDTGAIDPPPAGRNGFASLITFEGGTGAMSGASGQIRLRGEFHPTEGTTSGDYIGSLCTQ